MITLKSCFTLTTGNLRFFSYFSESIPHIYESMKSYSASAVSLLIYAVLFSIAFGSCKKKNEDPVPVNPGTSGKLTIFFRNLAGGQEIQFGQRLYTNAAGNNYQVDMLKYYVTNVVLIKDDSSEFKFNNYDLINAKVDSTCRIYGNVVPNGTYNRIRFYLGVDPVRNHTGAQDGDLDPVHGMIWTWNTGYIFFKHEGDFMDSTGSIEPLLYHYGTDPVLAQIELPIGALRIDNNEKKLYLNFDLNSLYGSTHTVEFNGNNIRQSSSVDDRDWLTSLFENFQNSFSYDRSE
ncbi:MAG: hypothetical protein DWQ33_09550 [Bacteroidetes bacterium]|nr:MAG: hypothetical protein DWQ33_09550 [Bacteroidota bacterium]